MNQLEFDFNKPKKSKGPDYKAIAQYLMSRRKIPEWYTDSVIRLNYKVMSETAARTGVQFPTFKEYERQESGRWEYRWEEGTKWAKK